MKIFRFLLPGFQQNWKVVLLSVIGAATFWFFNAMNKSYNTRVDYPLSYVFDRDSVIVVTPLSKTIKVDVSGGGWNLIRRTMKISATPIKIELENPTEIKFLTRSTLMPIVAEQLDELNLNQIITDTLFFDIEQKVYKRLSIVVDSTSIPLRDNYRIVSPIEIYDDSVDLVGPKSYMVSLPEEITLAFRDREIDSDFEDELSYKLEPIISATPNKTVIRFDVSRFLLREIDIPIEFLNLPENNSVRPTQSEIKIYYTINEDYEDEVQKSDFSVTADFKMLNHRDSTVAPLLMYAHEHALDIVLNVDKIGLNFDRIP